MAEQVTKELFETTMKGLEKLLNLQFNNNTLQHTAFDEKQKIANGRTKKLELKVAVATGCIMIFSVISGYVISDYFASKKLIRDLDKKVTTIENYFIIE